MEKTAVQPIHHVDRLYVISDLHLGGPPGFQIFGSSNELAGLIRLLADQDPDDEVALVINGDFVDFLAEEDATYFDPHGAIQKLERIAKDDTFRAVFEAFPYFLGKERRRLIVNLGNHDLELALPWVRERLVQILTGGQSAAPGAHSRLYLVFDGAGVLCSVGGRSVLCLHGNEVDLWNPANFERIREIARDVQIGRAVEPWIPNAGSKMVIDVMNPVKREYPFVDLLKPEQAAVAPTLAACAPQLVGELDRAKKLAAVALTRLWAGVRKPDGMLGANPVEDGAAPSMIDAPHAPIAAASRSRQAALQARELLLMADDRARHGFTATDLVAGAEGLQLDAFGALVKWSRKESTSEVLREALENLDRDRSFDIGERDDTAVQLDAQVSPDIDVVIAGHTHLERAMRRRNGPGCYFNSGTWARLIRIKAEVRADPQQFAQVFAALKRGTMADLDKAQDLVIKSCTVVVVWRDAEDSVKAELRHVKTINGKTELDDDLRASCMEIR
ncbi:metallophosphoesterase [Paraburkholderia terrae]|uniref:metallophosphoesterase n=1 Tax=Paraburkholderia terrae TaxID=311230 RepID=UPI002009E8AA|nr:metallophosphoesterase [Paraburkholderia terrae]